MENKPTLKSLAHELDMGMGGINLRCKVLSDVQELLILLVTDMNDKVHTGEEQWYFKGWHRELRVLNELMYYAMKDLNNDYEKVENIKSSIFDKVVRQEKQGVEDVDLNENKEKSSFL